MSANALARKRLLVLTSATGAGHDTHAHAAAEWCMRLFGGEVDVTVDHTLENSHVVYRRAVGFYNFIQRRAPWFHHFYYNLIELLDCFNPGTVGLGRSYYRELLERVRPDAVLSVMDCLNRGYFEYARETLGPTVICATYCPEFQGGYGFSRNWVNPRGDYFFARTEEGASEAIRRGAPPGRTLVAGHWAPLSFDGAATGIEEAVRELRTRLQLEAHRFTLLLSTGGNGAQNHRELLQALRPLGDQLQVIALCGHNETARAALQDWAGASLPFPVRCVGFTPQMPALLQASSAVVARAGATTAGEALLMACPIIFNRLGGIMPQEIPTWRYFRDRKIGFDLRRADQLRDYIQGWIDRPEDLQEVRATMRRVCHRDTPQTALELLLQKNAPV